MMKTIVITGSSRGIGHGLAKEFLARGHQVVVSGRSTLSTRMACDALAAIYGTHRLFAIPCDVIDAEQVQALWDGAVSRFGRIDIWINNAGIGNVYKATWAQSLESIDQVIKTDLLGTIYGTRTAYLGMQAQGDGHIYNMEGFGSDGRMGRGLTVYGSAKYAVRYFTRSFRHEMPRNTTVKLSLLSPGMVATELLTTAYETHEAFERSKRMLNILAEPLDTVAPWLAERILSNDKNGAEIRYLTTPKVLLKFFKAPFSRRDIFASAD